MKFKEIIKYLNINSRIADYSIKTGILTDPDCIEVTFYRTYLLNNIEHRVEVCIPSGYSGYFFEDFDGRYTDEDYDCGDISPDCWFDPIEDDFNSEWVARVVWFGDEYLKNDKFYLVKSTRFSYRTHDIDLIPKIHKIWNSKLWNIPEVYKNNRVQIVEFPNIDFRLSISKMKEL